MLDQNLVSRQLIRMLSRINLILNYNDEWRALTGNDEVDVFPITPHHNPAQVGPVEFHRENGRRLGEAA